MYRNRWSLLGIFLMAILVVSAGSVPAYAQAGTGPDDGLDFGVWRMLAVDTEQWMCFNYAGDNSPIQVDVWGVPSTGVDVCIRTPANMDVWRATGETQCVGRGTVNAVSRGNLHWAGSFNSKGAYCVTVKHNRSHADAVYYRAAIRGTGVGQMEPEAVSKAPAAESTGQPATGDMATPTSTPSPTGEDAVTQADMTDPPQEDKAAENTVAAPDPPGEESSEEDAAVITGDGPDTAFAPDGEWRRIEPGERHWYRLSIRKDRAIEVSLSGAPVNTAEFTVRTADQVEVWRRTGEELSIGRGTLPEPCGDDCVIIFGEVVEVGSQPVENDLFWTGEFNQNGMLWIVVESSARQDDPPGFYRLVVGGPGADR